MTTWYSDVFSSSAAASAPEGGYMAPPGRQDYPFMVSTFDASTSILDAEVVVMQPVDPNDRLRALFLTVDGDFNAATSIDIDLGLYKLKADRTLGDVIDADLFASSVDIDATAVARVDEFTEATTLANLDRMKRFWELADIGAGTYSRGPAEQWVICATLDITGTVTGAGILQLEAEIISG